MQYFFGNDNPIIYTMDHPDLILYSFLGNSIGLKRLNLDHFVSNKVEDSISQKRNNQNLSHL